MRAKEEHTARLARQYGEPIHAVLLFAPERRAATDAVLGRLLRPTAGSGQRGHVACLVANQVGPCESLVMKAATGRSE